MICFRFSFLKTYPSGCLVVIVFHSPDYIYTGAKNETIITNKFITSISDSFAWQTTWLTSHKQSTQPIENITLQKKTEVGFSHPSMWRAHNHVPARDHYNDENRMRVLLITKWEVRCVYSILASHTARGGVYREIQYHKDYEQLGVKIL